MNQDKRIRWSWDYLQEMSGESDNLYLLTEREIQFLLTPLSSAQWRTRWTDTIPTEDERQEFIATLQERLLTPMDICALIVDCIENSESVQEALRKFNSENGVPSGNSGANPFGIGIGEENILNGLSCSFDNIYGSCVAIIDYVEQSARDFVEIVLADSNAWGRVIRAIDFIPLIGDLPIVDDLNDLVNWFATNGAAAFDAGYTVSLRQELICDLFEAACAECTLTPYNLYTAYAQNAGIPLNPSDVFRALITNMLGLTGNTAFAMGACAMVAGALASGGSVLGIVGLNGLATIAASGNPDGDWALYCDDCITDCYTYNFIEGTQGWGIILGNPTLSTPRAQYVNGLGYTSWTYNVGGNNATYQIQIASPSPIVASATNLRVRIVSSVVRTVNFEIYSCTNNVGANPLLLGTLNGASIVVGTQDFNIALSGTYQDGYRIIMTATTTASFVNEIYITEAETCA